MKRPDWERHFSNKQFSYVVSWVCIVLASALLFPVVVTSTDAPLVAKITVCTVLVVMFALGTYSLIVEVIDYFKDKKQRKDEEDSE